MEWYQSIESFFERCVDFINQDLDITSLSEQVDGKEVHWKGQIKALELDKDYSKGVRIYTGIDDRFISNNRFVTFPTIRPVTTNESIQSWIECREGDWVEFSARIEGSGPFQCIRVLDFKGSDKIMLNVSLNNAFRINSDLSKPFAKLV